MMLVFQGRILILDGIEKAERNVLPTLNNLLENREMALSDGRFLMSPSRYDSMLQSGYTVADMDKEGLLRVSPDFRVIALGLPVPEFPGYPIDPPLRSRFQARVVHSYPIEHLQSRDQLTDPSYAYAITFFQAVEMIRRGGAGNSIGNVSKLLAVAQTAGDDMREVLRWKNCTSQSALWAVRKVYPYELFGLDASHIKAIESIQKSIDVDKLGEEEKSYIREFGSAEMPYSSTLESMVAAHKSGFDICLVGQKGEGKSFIIDQFAKLTKYVSNDCSRGMEVVCCYKDMTSRDLIMRRR
jgi:MoxR-like ATPase